MHMVRLVVAASLLSVGFLSGSYEAFAFDFGDKREKYGALRYWRIDHETGRISRCGSGDFDFERGQYKAAPKCSPWSGPIGNGYFRLSLAYDDGSAVYVIDTKTGRVAICMGGFGTDVPPLCSPLTRN